MANGVMMHAGGWTASENEVAAVAVPERTSSYTPIPHARVIEQLRNLLPGHGLKLERLSLGLAEGGAKLFGVADVVNGTGSPDWGLSIGFRNSYNRSMSLRLGAGSHVFVCDNMAFHAEVQLSRRHVGTLDTELPGLVDGLIGRVCTFKDTVRDQINLYKLTDLSDLRAHDLVVRALREGIVPANHVPAVVKEWHEPSHEEFAPRTAWSLLNAFTEVAKRRSPALQMRSTLSLNGLFSREFARTN